jgi:hypothetical protein
MLNIIIKRYKNFKIVSRYLNNLEITRRRNVADFLRRGSEVTRKKLAITKPSLEKNNIGFHKC